MVEHGFVLFLIAYAAPLALYSCSFAFSIMFTKHLSFIKKNGHPDPNACCNACCTDDGCCAPPPNQPAVYQQPGVALQVGIAEPEKDGVLPGTLQAAPGQVVLMQQTVNGVNHRDIVSRAMMTNGGCCWKVTLIVLWSLVLIGAIPQFIVGCWFIYHNGRDDMWRSRYEKYVPLWTLTFVVPGLIGVIAAPISIYGVSKYNYKLNVFSCVALCLSLLDGLILLMFEDGAGYFFVCYVPPFILYSCTVGFTIKFTRRIRYIQENGHADDVNDDCCKGCYECCQCKKNCCECCAG